MNKKKQTDEFLVDFLGDDFKLISSYEFDVNPNRFHNIKAPDHVIKKLRDAGYVRD